MDRSAGTTELAVEETPDGISVGRWLAGYGVFVLAGAGLLALLAHQQPWNWGDWRADASATLGATSAAVKLLFFLLYLSLANTFLPLPTGWLVAAVATRQVAVAAGVSDEPLVVGVLTTLLVASVGAVGSTLANLNEYHLLTWMLRSRRVGRLRRTRAVEAAQRWFARSPFFLVTVFNVLPIPIDVVRMLATTSRYPRRAFAGANLLGRFIRYAIIAATTFWVSIHVPDKQWIPSVALLALGAVLALPKLGAWARRRLRPARACERA